MAFPTLHFFFTTKPILSLYFFTFLVLGSALISSASKLPGNETDIISLLQFKKMIKEDPFGVMASWNETIHFCEWPGVLCGRRHLRVMSLNLMSLKLVGSLPSYIGNLSFLKALDLQNNSFSVKVLDLLHHGASRSFVAECEVLKNTRHRNLVEVLTACSGFDLQGNDFKAIVYEYMDSGNLENWLHFSPQENSQIEDNKSLCFVERLNILIDVACALDYLHNDCEPAIIHCDLKPSNVLLDKNMTAHVSDFGLARFVQQRIQSSSSDNHSLIGVQGTVGYAPPEYGIGSRPSKAGDVYSFGILILEMFTGKRPTDELFKDGLNLHSYAKAGLADRGVEIADPKLVQERDEQTQMCLVCMFKVGVACSVEFPAYRLKIRDVVGELNKARKFFLMH
ncbi:PREDICTED: LRR receptor-like serine/threonine-protein kinase EFR [Ipomoea nil]|uniref:LRR receptor-like serine/threonine-protein kinase EFR n=1 Tax=Ipomoea nil TaxID=35883 RepID=UPI000901F858|nr:PREDICTED: LRR receptor-like serine/threonine-protein kinase EFR [Ipomoea nil]